MGFSNPPDPRGYAVKVYELVSQIPRGRVMTYGQIAGLIPPPAGMDPLSYHKLSPRWVGSAMAQAPDEVPWQRVINSQGKISPRPGMGPLAQRHLLEQEGVVFDARERVDLKRHGWPGPDADWLLAHGYLPPPEVEGQQPRLL